MSSTITVSVAPRVFRAGALEIADTNPALPADESWRLIRDNYPHLQSALLSQPTLENGVMVVDIECPPVKTNG
ncbi:hypothetical protein [Endozoicomonas sp. ALC066]|uniref:hypothetical protein n=1 Tax=Endozoicomonas sp. ALC066 TaxID=3403078 RepID=UPI003BB541A8